MEAYRRQRMVADQTSQYFFSNMDQSVNGRGTVCFIIKIGIQSFAFTGYRKHKAFLRNVPIWDGERAPSWRLDPLFGLIDHNQILVGWLLWLTVQTVWGISCSSVVQWLCRLGGWRGRRGYIPVCAFPNWPRMTGAKAEGSVCRCHWEVLIRRERLKRERESFMHIQ